MNKLNSTIAPKKEGTYNHRESARSQTNSANSSLTSNTTPKKNPMINPLVGSTREARPNQPQTLLVALDQTPLTTKVFDHALTIAKERQGSLQLVHCTEIKIWENLGPMIDAGMGLRSRTVLNTKQEIALQQELGKLQVWLEDFCQSAVSQGVEADYQISQVGGAGPVICDLAQRLQAHAIIVGSHGKRGLQELFLGSVSKYVTHNAHCLTIVVQTGDQPDLQFPAAR